MNSLLKADDVILDETCSGFPLSAFCIPERYIPYLQSVLIPNGMIKDRIQRIAADIVEYYVQQGVKSISMMCVLKGGFKYFSDLIEEMQKTIWSRKSELSLAIEFVRVKSYTDTTSGNVVISEIDNALPIDGKHVLIIDDLVDTGKTMVQLYEHVMGLGAASVQVSCLLLKRTHLNCGYRPNFLGFQVPDRFIVGYAIDYNECFRDLLHICSINQKAKETFAMNTNQEVGTLPTQ